MRAALGAIAERRTYTARFIRYGSKTAYKGPPIRTLLFRDIATGGNVVCDHLWFRTCRTWQDLGELVAGDQVSFTASVKTYQKGYRGRRDDDDLPAPSTDYKLAWPRDAALVEGTARSPDLQFRLVFDVAPPE